MGSDNMNYDLERFIAAQKRDYTMALQEIKNGCKSSHWMWYIFPQISGLGRSLIAKKYEIVDLGEAKAYVENTYLRNNLIEISRALLECGIDNAEDIMGFPDNLKLCSSMTLFEMAAPDIQEFGMVLNKFYGGKRDKRTIELAKE